MKKTILFLITCFLLSACSKDDAQTEASKLPPETQTGANTFGVTINGKVYVPRTPSGYNYGGSPPNAMKLVGGGIIPDEYTELVVVDGKSPVGFKITLHIQNLLNVGTYHLKQSNFQDQYDSVLLNHIFFKIWDANISNYAYYGSIENQGEVNITRLSNGIVSGNFIGKFVRYDNPNEFIQINDGRFDINSFTIQNHPFP